MTPQLPVVLQHEVSQLRHPALLGQVLGKLDLLRGNVDAPDVDLVLLGEEAVEGAPPAPDVDHGHPRLELQLLRD